MMNDEHLMCVPKGTWIVSTIRTYDSMLNRMIQYLKVTIVTAYEMRVLLLQCTARLQAEAEAGAGNKSLRMILLQQTDR